MTTDVTTENVPATPPIVDRDTWLRERDELLVREKAHTREGDAIAAARWLRWSRCHSSVRPDRRPDRHL